MIIALEGCDGVGKATQAKILAERCHACLISFPVYGTEVGRAILGNLKQDWEACEENTDSESNQRWCSATRLNALVLQALQTVNRYEVAPVIEEALVDGRPVVLDRYWASGYVYGAADGLDPEWLRRIHGRLPQPDAWVLLDAPPEVSVQRRPERRDRYEMDDRMGLRRKLYLDLFKSGDQRWQVADAVGTVEEVANRVRDALARAGIAT